MSNALTKRQRSKRRCSATLIYFSDAAVLPVRTTTYPYRAVRCGWQSGFVTGQLQSAQIRNAWQGVIGVKCQGGKFEILPGIGRVGPDHRNSAGQLSYHWPVRPSGASCDAVPKPQPTLLRECKFRRRRVRISLKGVLDRRASRGDREYPCAPY